MKKLNYNKSPIDLKFKIINNLYGFIYVGINTVKGKVYIGQTCRTIDIEWGSLLTDARTLIRKMMYEVNTAKCSGCGSCIEICPFEAIYMVDDKAQIDEAKCKACRKCLDVCPNGAIAVRYESQPKSIPVYAKRSNIEFSQSKAIDKIIRLP